MASVTIQLWKEGILVGKITIQPKGWSPNFNEREQNPALLLRADNLVFDEDGCVKTARGTSRISSGAFGSAPNALYSQALLGSTVGSATPVVKCRYVSNNGTVVRNYSGGTPTETDFSGALLTGGDASYAAFGNAWGHTFVFSGTKKRADHGAASSWRDLGIAAAGTPTVVRNTPPSISIFTPWVPTVDWSAVEGTAASSADWVKVDVDATTFRGILHAPGYSVVENLDLTNFTATGQDTPDDIFSLLVRVADTATLSKIRVEFLLQTEVTPGSGAPDVKDYYWKEWDAGNYFREGSDFWGSIQCLRSEFTRAGIDGSLSWATVKAMRVIIEAADVNELYIGEPKFQGGSNGVLNGTYSYIQVNVNETGDYTEVGIAGSAAADVQVINGSTTVTPAAVAGNVNKVYIYRASEHTPTYYRVKEVTSPYSAFTDSMSDVDAVQAGNAIDQYRTALPDGIRHVVAPYFDRAIYFDIYNCYPSYRYDPGSYDLRHEFRICGTDSEIILWAQKNIDEVIYVGTTNDVYAISGDFSYDETTGLINVSVKALGVKQAPISSSVAVWSNNLIYLAEDGWRMVSGSSSNTITDAIDSLYKSLSLHGVGYTLIGARNANVNNVVVAHNKLYCAVTDSVDGRSLHIYDFVRKQWTYWRNTVNGNNTPLHLYVEEDGNIIFSTGSGGDKYLYSFDVPGTTNTLGEGGNNSFILRTAYLCGEQPNNRKVPFNLKIKADSNNENVTITVRAIENSGVSTLNFTQAFNGVTQVVLRIDSGLGNPKYFQLEVTGTVSKFLLVDAEIVYDSLPEQVSYLKLQPNSFGTDQRKRIPAIPFEIDTLGTDTYFVPILDGVSQGALLINTSRKTTVTYKFPGDKVARVLDGYFYSNAGVFELYGMLQSTEIETLPEALNFKLIPANNLGSSRRKRISQIAFVINTNGNAVVFTPYVDGVVGTPANILSNEKALKIHTFASETTGLEVGGTFYSTGEFELYGLELSECVYEALPPITKFYRLASTNLGTTRRKRFSQIGYVVNPLGGTLTFTPYINGVAQTPSTATGTEKATFIHVFSTEIIGIDIGFTLASTTDFEFYELSASDTAYEVLPPVTKFHRLQSTNFGTPSKKRIRTLAFSLDTKGNNVTFTPIVDGISKATSTFNSTGKRTLLHYFNEDIFGIDFSGTFESSGEFEFYEQLQPLNVETLPIGRLWDQVGPLDFNRQAKVKWVRYTLLSEGTSLDYRIFSNDTLVTSGTATTQVGKEHSIEIPMPYGVEVELCRAEFSSDSIFHRMKVEFKVSVTGKDTEQKWIEL